MYFLDANCTSGHTTLPISSTSKPTIPSTSKPPTTTTVRVPSTTYRRPASLFQSTTARSTSVKTTTKTVPPPLPLPVKKDIGPTILSLLCSSLLVMIIVLIFVVYIMYRLMKNQYNYTSRLCHILERRTIYRAPPIDEEGQPPSPDRAQTPSPDRDQTSRKEVVSPNNEQETSFVSVDLHPVPDSASAAACAAAQVLGQQTPSESAQTLNFETPLVDLSSTKSSSSETVIYENISPISSRTRAKNFNP